MQSIAGLRRRLLDQYTAQWYLPPDVERMYAVHKVQKARIPVLLWCIATAFVYSSLLLWDFIKDPDMGGLALTRLPVAITSVILGALAAGVGPIRPYILHLTAGAIFLYGVYHAFVIEYVAVEAVANIKRQELQKVLQKIEGDSVAMAELDAFLKSNMYKLSFTHNYAFALAHGVTGLFMGFTHLTGLSLALTPVTFLVAEKAHLSSGAGVLWNLVAVVAMVYFVSSIIGVEKILRRQFSAKHLFEQKLAEAVAHNRKADTILNHTLKNIMADASGEMEMFLGGIASVPPEKKPDREQLQHLSDAMANLRRGMRWCRHRQVYLQLVANTYTPMYRRINLRDFGSDLVEGRLLTASFGNLNVFLDPVVCGLILDNSISNAGKHGHPTNPDVTVTIEQWGDQTIQSTARPTGPLISLRSVSPEKHIKLAMVVKNRAAPGTMLSEEFASSMMESDFRPPNGQLVPALSDQIGLRHSYLAAKAIGTTLKLYQEGDTVVFRALMTVRLASEEQAQATSSPTHLPSIPENLCIFCIDDSATACKLLAASLAVLFRTKAVTTLGQSKEHVARFPGEVMEHKADIVILDQNLDYGKHCHYRGSDLVKELVALGFGGLICIRSGNVEEHDCQLYTDCGAHLVVGKDVPLKEASKQIQQEYLRRFVPPAQAPLSFRIEIADAQGLSDVMPVRTLGLPSPCR